MKILIVASEKDSTGAYHHFATSDIMDHHINPEWWIDRIQKDWDANSHASVAGNKNVTLEFRTFVEAK